MLYFLCIGIIILILKIICRYFIYKNNKCVCTNYSEYKCNCIESKYKQFLIVNINKMINIIFLIYTIMMVLYLLKEISNNTNLYEEFEWFTGHSDILNTILGAFLASTLGILTQAYTTKKNEKSEEVQYAILLYEEIFNLITVIEEMQLKHKLYTDKREILTEPSIYYYKDWRSYYIKLNNRLTSEHYRKILSLYDIVALYNNAVAEKDYDEFLLAIELFNKWKGKSYSPLREDIEYYELMDDLELVAQNKKREKRIFEKLKEEFDIKRLKAKYVKEIEQMLIMFIKEKNERTSYLINKELIDVLKTKSDFGKVSIKNIERIIFEVAMNSKRLDKQWGKYYIVETKKSI